MTDRNRFAGQPGEKPHICGECDRLYYAVDGDPLDRCSLHRQTGKERRADDE